MSLITAALQLVSSVLLAACHVAMVLIGAGVDYDSGPYVVTFPAGVTHASFDVPITNDIMLEGDENFNLIIESLSLLTGVSVSNPAQITVTIVDDDGNVAHVNFIVVRLLIVKYF